MYYKALQVELCQVCIFLSQKPSVGPFLLLFAGVPVCCFTEENKKLPGLKPSGVPAVPRLKTRTALDTHESCFSLKQVRSTCHARGGGVEIANKLGTSCCVVSLQGYAVGRYSSKGMQSSSCEVATEFESSSRLQRQICPG